MGLFVSILVRSGNAPYIFLNLTLDLFQSSYDPVH
jgi:hypothetical protein